MPQPANLLLGKLDPQHTAHPFPDVVLNPEGQHVPLDPAKSTLRPPPPQLAADSAPRATIRVSATSFRDGRRCAFTVLSALRRARHPDRLRISVVDQALDGEDRCLATYCELARAEFAAATSQSECPYGDQIVVDEQDARKARGPVIPRHYAQMLVRDDDEFCLGVDVHSVFTTDWDVYLIKDWLEAENEMGVISTYVHHAADAVIAPNGDNTPYEHTPHICDSKVGGHGIPSNEGATIIHNATRPNLQSKWGARFSFSKCHSERRVKFDPHADWMLDGEEFSHAALMWMSGYDFYSPSRYGQVVYFNYTFNPIAVTWDKEEVTEKMDRSLEEETAANRVKLHIGQPFEGNTNTKEFDKYTVSERNKARTLQQFLEFTGVSYSGKGNWTHRCHQLHWVPYAHPDVVETLVPGWRQEEVPKVPTPISDANVERTELKKLEECLYHGTCDQLATLSNGLCWDGMMHGVPIAINLFLIFGFTFYFLVARRRRVGVRATAFAQDVKVRATAFAQDVKVV